MPLRPAAPVGDCNCGGRDVPLPDGHTCGTVDCWHDTAGRGEE